MSSDRPPPWNTSTTPRRTSHNQATVTPENPIQQATPSNRASASGSSGHNATAFLHNARMNSQGNIVFEPVTRRSSRGDSSTVRGSEPTTPQALGSSSGQRLQTSATSTAASPFAVRTPTGTNFTSPSSKVKGLSLIPVSVSSRPLGKSHTLSGEGGRSMSLSDPFVESPENKRPHRLSLGPLHKKDEKPDPLNVTSQYAPSIGRTKQGDTANKLDASSWRPGFNVKSEEKGPKDDQGSVRLPAQQQGRSSSHQYGYPDLPRQAPLSLAEKVNTFSALQDPFQYHHDQTPKSPPSSLYSIASVHGSQVNVTEAQDLQSAHQRVTSGPTGPPTYAALVEKELSKAERKKLAKRYAEQIKAGAANSVHSSQQGSQSTSTHGSDNFRPRPAAWRPPHPDTVFATHQLSAQGSLPFSAFTVPALYTGGEDYTPRVYPQTPPYNYPGQVDPILTQFNHLIVPDMVSLMAHSPFLDMTAGLQASTAGVLKISDIPYNTTRQEITAFFGRRTRLITMPQGTPFYAIHIIFDRSTAKSMDAYVELETAEDANVVAQRFTQPTTIGPFGGRDSRRRPRIGTRDVTVTVASQEELMQQLFPHAKCVTWNGQDPIVDSPHAPWQSGFRGFIASEELHNLVKFALNPNRSRYAGNHVQRTFESLISVVNKFPWWRTELFTIAQRDKIYETTHDMIQILAGAVFKADSSTPPHLNLQLVEELVTVALSCPAFSEEQRWKLWHASAMMIGMPRHVSAYLAWCWPFETLRRNLGISEQLSRWFAKVLKTHSEATVLKASTRGDKKTSEVLAKYSEDPFGPMATYQAGSPKHTTFKEGIQHETFMLRGMLNDWCKVTPKTVTTHVGSAEPTLPPPTSAVPSQASDPTATAHPSSDPVQEMPPVPPPMDPVTPMQSVSSVAAGPPMHPVPPLQPVPPIQPTPGYNMFHQQGIQVQQPPYPGPMVFSPHVGFSAPPSPFFPPFGQGSPIVGQDQYQTAGYGPPGGYGMGPAMYPGYGAPGNGGHGYGYRRPGPRNQGGAYYGQQ